MVAFALSRDVIDSPVGTTLLDQQLVVYRTSDGVVVADDICPHRGVALSAGTGDGTSVACAYHGIRFGSGGICVAVPAHPRSKIPARLNLRGYPTVERYGLVWTCLRPDPNGVIDQQLPTMPHWDDPGFQQVTKNMDTDQDPRQIYDFNLRIFEEDRAIVEIQKPENLPLDPRIEVNIAADRSSVAYRRGLRGLGLSQFFTT